MSDLDLLRDLTTDIQPPPFDDLVATARRRDHQTAAITVAGCLAVGAIVIVGAIWARGDTPTSPQPIGPLPSITVHPVEEPAGQTEVTADIGADDLTRWEEVETQTTEATPGATRIDESTRPVSLYFELRGFCHGDPETWWIVSSSYGGGDYGQCSPDGSMTATPPTDVTAADPMDDESLDASHGTWEVEVRMLATGPIPQRNQDCFAKSRANHDIDFDKCIDGLEELPSTDATFGFTMYADRAPDVADVTGQGFEALAVVDGQEYTFSRAVLGAPGESSMAVNLPYSEQPRLVGIRQKGQEEPTILVDGEPVDQRDAPFMARIDALATATLIPPGFHTIVVQSPEAGAKPGEVHQGLVIYEATP
jgi:hypothetical protein